MKRVLLLALGLLLLTSTAFAKDVQKHLPGDLTLDEARTVLDAALVKARAQGVPMNIAIVDAGGNLKAFVRIHRQHRRVHQKGHHRPLLQHVHR